MKFTPTSEQEQAKAAFRSGSDLIIQAGAGTGKTATLNLLAKMEPHTSFRYLAFNRAIVTEAGASMPDNVTASTIHSLAYRAVGYKYRARLDSPRMRGTQIALALKVQTRSYSEGEEISKTLSATYLAGLVMKSIGFFCQSADRAPSKKHIPYVDGIDAPASDGRRGYRNNNLLGEYLEQFLTTAWADLSSTTGQLKFDHAHYLKLYELSGPRIGADVILFDEAQDVSPVMASIVRQQVGRCRLVYVGDSNQSIYSFMGAVDAMTHLEAAVTTTLSKSFRFGQPIADIANLVLAELPTEMRIIGFEKIKSEVKSISEPDAILCRTNAVAVSTLISRSQAGVAAHLVGGGGEQVGFARGAMALQAGRSTDYPELACFKDWGEVRKYVTEDEQGGDLKLMFDLVEKFGAQVIVDAINAMPNENNATLVISTAHKAKGRQWSKVQLAGDFPEEREGMSADELRLLYVAVTRAENELDVGMVTWLTEPTSAFPSWVDEVPQGGSLPRRNGVANAIAG